MGAHRRGPFRNRQPERDEIGEIGKDGADGATAWLAGGLQDRPRTIWLGPEAVRSLDRCLGLRRGTDLNRLYSFWVGVRDEA